MSKEHYYKVGSILISVILAFSSATQLEQESSGSSVANSPALQERHRFESLLAAGRTLSFPYATGLILTAVSSQRENWNVSLQGLSNILNLSPDQLCSTYKDTMELIKQDDNVTTSSNLYLLQNQKSDPTLADRLDKLQIAVNRLKWEEDHFNASWDLMNNNLNEKTNNLLDAKLIPKDSPVGNPFRFSTQAIMLTTFHYRNYWKNVWASGGFEKFGDAENVPFLQAEGNFLYADAEDYYAVNIPLQGDEKSMVFIMPKINLTQYLRHVKRKVLASRVRGDEEEDFVPFPRRWEKRDLSIHLPSFSLKNTDQYGKELDELGMNQTFCTTLRDRSGTIPFYLRPIVSINVVNITTSHVEIASATGTALEKFYLGIDLGGVGYPKSVKEFEGQANPSIVKDKLKSSQNGDESSVAPISGGGDGETNLDNGVTDNPDAIKTTPSGSSDAALPGEKIVFNRPFLWYLNDSKLGPLFFGVVEQTETESDPDPDENSRFSEETQKYLLWSCRSFKQSGENGK